MDLLDNKMWDIIEKMNWDTRSRLDSRAYEKIKVEFMREHDEDTAKLLDDFVTERYRELDRAYDAFEAEGNRAGDFGGDDSYSDMMHHVIGSGREVFEGVLEDLTMLDYVHWVESFAYVIPHFWVDGTSDYDELDESYHVEHARQCIAALAEVVANGSIGHDLAMTIGELFSRNMALIAGDYVTAFADLTRADYNRFCDIHPEYSAMFANYLFDARKVLDN